MTYDEVLYSSDDKELVEDVALFRATWPNGNDPDGDTIVSIDVLSGVTRHGGRGYILLCDDNEAGGSQREAGETVYPSLEAATAAAKAYATEHHEAQ